MWQVKTMTSSISRGGHALEDSNSDACRNGIVSIIHIATDVLHIIRKDYRLPSSMQPPTFSDPPSVQPPTFSMQPPTFSYPTINDYLFSATSYIFKLAFSAASYLFIPTISATFYLFSVASSIFRFTFSSTFYTNPPS